MPKQHFAVFPVRHEHTALVGSTKFTHSHSQWKIGHEIRTVKDHSVYSYWIPSKCRILLIIMQLSDTCRHSWNLLHGDMSTSGALLDSTAVNIGMKTLQRAGKWDTCLGHLCQLLLSHFRMISNSQEVVVAIIFYIDSLYFWRWQTRQPPNL